MRRWAVLTVIVLQLAVLAAMAGNREYIVHFGQRGYLQTAPIDPGISSAEIS